MCTVDPPDAPKPPPPPPVKPVTAVKKKTKMSGKKKATASGTSALQIPMSKGTLNTPY
jgi:hypothetical protein